MNSVESAHNTSASPSSIEAERSILGAILLDNRVYDEAEQITYNDFVLSSHRTIFGRMAGLIADGVVVDIITLAQAMRDHRELDAIGGLAYLASLTELLPRHLSITSYVELVREKAQRRSLISFCNLTISKAEDSSIDTDELLSEADMGLMKISAESEEANVETLAQASEREFTRMMAERDSGSNFIGIPTGLDVLDDKIGGWVEGELAIIAGKPGQGKSSALIQTLVQCGRDGVPAHCFSPEMTKGQILRRIWAMVASLRFHLIRHPTFLHTADVRLLSDVKTEVSRWPLVIDDDTNMTVAQIVSRARISKRRHGTRLIGVDYLQKIRYVSKPEFRHVEVSDAAVRLANLAKKEQVAVIALSSLTDRGGKGKNSTPTLGDLRQSGDIQYEAATVVFIHREVEDSTERIHDDGWMIIPKQRNGETGQFPVRYNNRLMFEADAKQAEPAGPMQYALPHKNDDF